MGGEEGKGRGEGERIKGGVRYGRGRKREKTEIGIVKNEGKSERGKEKI